MNYFIELKKYDKTRKQVRKDVIDFIKKENIDVKKAFPVLEYFEKIFEKDKNYTLYLTEKNYNITYTFSDITNKYNLYLSKNYYKYIENDYIYRENITQFIASYYLLKDFHNLYIEQDEIDYDVNKLYWKILDLYKEELLLPYDMYKLEDDPGEVCEKYKITFDLYMKMTKKKFFRKTREKNEKKA